MTMRTGPIDIRSNHSHLDKPISTSRLSHGRHHASRNSASSRLPFLLKNAAKDTVRLHQTPWVKSAMANFARTDLRRTSVITIEPSSLTFMEDPSGASEFQAVSKMELS